MHRYQRLMVGLARGEADMGLIRYAAMVARWGAVRTIRFIHVLSHSPGGETTLNQNEMISELRAAVEHDFPNRPNVEIAFDVCSGPLTDCLLARTAEQEIDLLLIGASRAHANRRVLARRLAMKAPCSVWIVPDGASDSVTRILAPIDFSEPAADSLAVAVSMARLSEAECLALHVYFNEAVVTYEEYDEVLRGQEAETYRKFIDPINCQGVDVKPVFEEGANVVHVIGHVAEREAADLIVMGTRGRSQSAAILLGSVTEQIISDSNVPLLAVKHFGARLGVLQALLDRRFLRTPGLRTD